MRLVEAYNIDEIGDGKSYDSTGKPFVVAEKNIVGSLAKISNNLIWFKRPTADENHYKQTDFKYTKYPPFGEYVDASVDIKCSHNIYGCPSDPDSAMGNSDEENCKLQLEHQTGGLRFKVGNHIYVTANKPRTEDLGEYISGAIADIVALEIRNRLLRDEWIKDIRFFHLGQKGDGSDSRGWNVNPRAMCIFIPKLLDNEAKLTSENKNINIVTRSPSAEQCSISRSDKI